MATISLTKADAYQESSADPRKGRADWIDAAEQALVEEGIDAVRITRLAEALEVTRGSFYWHFKDRDDLLACLIQRWELKNTAAVLSAIADVETLADGILNLFDIWIDPELFDPRLDSALRDWARSAATVRDAVEQADAARIAAIKALFERFGYQAPEAFIRARVIYFAQIGYYALVKDEPMAERSSYLESYYLSFTGEALDPAVAAAYRTRHPVDEESSR